MIKCGHNLRPTVALNCTVRVNENEKVNNQYVFKSLQFIFFNLAFLKEGLRFDGKLESQTNFHFHGQASEG